MFLEWLLNQTRSRLEVDTSNAVETHELPSSHASTEISRPPSPMDTSPSVPLADSPSTAVVVVGSPQPPVEPPALVLMQALEEGPTGAVPIPAEPLSHVLTPPLAPSSAPPPQLDFFDAPPAVAPPNFAPECTSEDGSSLHMDAVGAINQPNGGRKRGKSTSRHEEDTYIADGSDIVEEVHNYVYLASQYCIEDGSEKATTKKLVQPSQTVPLGASEASSPLPLPREPSRVPPPPPPPSELSSRLVKREIQPPAQRSGTRGNIFTAEYVKARPPRQTGTEQRWSEDEPSLSETDGCINSTSSASTARQGKFDNAAAARRTTTQARVAQQPEREVRVRAPAKLVGSSRQTSSCRSARGADSHPAPQEEPSGGASELPCPLEEPQNSLMAGVRVGEKLPDDMSPELPSKALSQSMQQVEISSVDLTNIELVPELATTPVPTHTPIHEAWKENCEAHQSEPNTAPLREFDSIPQQTDPGANSVITHALVTPPSIPSQLGHEHSDSPSAVPHWIEMTKGTDEPALPPRQARATDGTPISSQQVSVAATASHGWPPTPSRSFVHADSVPWLVRQAKVKEQEEEEDVWPSSLERWRVLEEEKATRGDQPDGVNTEQECACIEVLRTAVDSILASKSLAVLRQDRNSLTRFQSAITSKSTSDLLSMDGQLRWVKSGSQRAANLPPLSTAQQCLVRPNTSPGLIKAQHTIKDNCLHERSSLQMTANPKSAPLAPLMKLPSYPRGVKVSYCSRTSSESSTSTQVVDRSHVISADSAVVGGTAARLPKTSPGTLSALALSHHTAKHGAPGFLGSGLHHAKARCNETETFPKQSPRAVNRHRAILTGVLMNARVNARSSNSTPEIKNLTSPTRWARSADRQSGAGKLQLI